MRKFPYSQFINNSEPFYYPRNDSRPRGFYDESNTFFQRLKFQTLYQENVFRPKEIDCSFFHFILNSRSKKLYSLIQVFLKHIS